MLHRFLLLFIGALLGWFWPNPELLAQAVFLSLAQQQEDLVLFRTGLSESHGGLYYYVQKPYFEHQCDSIARTFRAGATREAYYLKLRYLLTLAHHGHSRISLPERFADFRANILQPGQRYLPLRVRLISGRQYALQDCSPENVVPAGAEIQAINGLAVPALLKAMRRYIPADGRNTTFKDYQLYEYYNFHFLYQLLHPEAASFTLKLRGARQSVRVSGQTPAQLAQVYQQRAGKSLSYFDKPLVYQATLAPGAGYVKAGSFYKGFVENFKTPFEPFIDSVLADVQRHGTRHVILDLRGNEGGGDGYAEYLFARLTNQPFQGPGHDRVAGRRFTTLPYLRNASDDIKAFLANPNQFLRNDTTLLLKPEYAGDAPQQPAAGQPYLGPLYVLTNGGTFSAGTALVGYLYQQRQASARPVWFVGEENGGDIYSNVLCAGQSYSIELPSSGVLVDMPFLCGGRLNRIPPATRLPDYYVQPTIEQVLKGQDAEVEFVLRRIAKGK